VLILGDQLNLVSAETYSSNLFILCFYNTFCCTIFMQCKNCRKIKKTAGKEVSIKTLIKNVDYVDGRHHLNTVFETMLIFFFSSETRALPCFSSRHACHLYECYFEKNLKDVINKKTFS
jgi:hypothetical protein